jgi:hypothetical protein
MTTRLVQRGPLSPAVVAAWSQPAAMVALVIFSRSAIVGSFVLFALVGPLVGLAVLVLLVVNAVAISQREIGGYVVAAIVYSLELAVWLVMPGRQHLEAGLRLAGAAYISLLIAVVFGEVLWFVFTGHTEVVDRRERGRVHRQGEDAG